MNSIIKFLSIWASKILLLAILFNTINCDCNSKNTTHLNNKPDDTHTDDKETKQKFYIELTAAEDEVIDKDLIEFQLTNKGTEEIDLEHIILNLEITKKNYNGHEINTGGMSPILPNKSINIKVGKGLDADSGLSAADFTGKQKIAPNAKESIFIRIVDLIELSTGQVKCKLINKYNKNTEIASKVVSFKFTKPILPQADIQLDATIGEVVFTDATKELTFKTQIKNITNNPISLADLKFEFEFGGSITGNIRRTSQDLLGSHTNSILEPGKTIDLPIIISGFKDKSVIESLKNSVGTDDALFITSHISTKKDKVLFNIKQPVSLSSPDIPEIGPKQGSTIEHRLDIQKIIFNNGKITLPIIFHNTSDHTIDLEKLEHEVNIYQGQHSLMSTKFTGDKLKWAERLLRQGGTITSNFTLEEDITENILANNHAATTLEFITKSKKDGQLVGQLEQPFKIKVGPIVGESTVDIIISDNISLEYDDTESKYKAVFTISVKNTSNHIININQANFYGSFISTPVKNNISVDRQGDGQSGSIFLKQDEVYDMPISIGLGNITEEDAKNFLSTNNFSFEITMETLDANYVVGTKKQEMKFNK